MRSICVRSRPSNRKLPPMQCTMAATASSSSGSSSVEEECWEASSGRGAAQARHSRQIARRCCIGDSSARSERAAADLEHDPVAEAGPVEGDFAGADGAGETELQVLLLQVAEAVGGLLDFET